MASRHNIPYPPGHPRYRAPARPVAGAKDAGPGTLLLVLGLPIAVLVLGGRAVVRAVRK